MRKMLIVLLLSMVCIVAVPVVAQAKQTWKYPLYSVAHASDGLGLTNGSLSLHRVYSSRHAMLDVFTIYGTTYTWTRPADASFLIPPWTSDSIVSCGQCHTTISMLGSTPASGYPGAYETLRLAATANGMSANDVICAKCHDLVQGATWSNSVHASTKHRNAYGRCVSCHLQLPHGSGLPRLLGYAQDPSPYSTVTTGLAGIARGNYTPTSWRKRDCTSACHSQSFTSWPSGGSVAGTIRTTSGAPLPGATVTIVSQTTTTNASGAYRIDNVGVGYVVVRIAASGYSGGFINTTVTGGSVATVDATLTPTP